MSEGPIIPAGIVGLPPLDDARPARRHHTPEAKRHRRHTADRFGVLNAFIDLTAGTLTRAELLTWLILFRDTKPDGTCRTAQSDIARRAGTDSRTIRRALQRLTALGLVRIVWQGGFRKGASIYAVAPLATEPNPRGKRRCR